MLRNYSYGCDGSSRHGTLAQFIELHWNAAHLPKHVNRPHRPTECSPVSVRRSHREPKCRLSASPLRELMQRAETFGSWLICLATGQEQGVGKLQEIECWRDFHNHLHPSTNLARTCDGMHCLTPASHRLPTISRMIDHRALGQVHQVVVGFRRKKHLGWWRS